MRKGMEESKKHLDSTTTEKANAGPLSADEQKEKLEEAKKDGN